MQMNSDSRFSLGPESSEISIETLLGSISNTKGANVMKQKISNLQKSSVAPKPLEKVTSERIERNLTYGNTKQEMDKWQDTVINNRNEKCLDLSQDRRELPDYKDLVKKFNPRTEMEKEIEMVLVNNSMSEKDLERAEEDELGSRYEDMEEMKMKAGELSKIRALMFYEQMKRHRLNKIKSKAYHRIRNKKFAAKNQNQSEGDDLMAVSSMDPQVAAQLQEEEMNKVIRERMDLKHKNTGKWAKMAIKHARGDKSLRMAYHESVQLGHELTQRIHTDPNKRNDSTVLSSINTKDSDDSSSSDSDDDEDEHGSHGFKIEKIKESTKAAKKMKTVLAESHNSDIIGTNSKYSKLLDMDFMKNAARQKQEKAKEDAQQILKELRELEDDSDSSETEEAPVGDTQSAVQQREKEAKKQRLAAAKADIVKAMGSSSGMGISSASTQSKVRVEGFIRVPTRSLLASAGMGGGTWDDNDLDQSLEEEAAGKEDGGSSRSQSHSFEETAGPAAKSNPWIQQHPSSTRTNAINNSSGDSERVMIRVDPANNIRQNKNHSSNNKSNDNSSTKLSLVLESSSSVTVKDNNKQQRPKSHDTAPASHPSPSIVKPLTAPVAAASTSHSTSSLRRVPASTAKAEDYVVTSSNARPQTNKKNLQQRKPLLMQKSQEELVRAAFSDKSTSGHVSDEVVVGPDLESEFMDHKRKHIDEEIQVDEKKMKILSQDKAGWGDWAGPGLTGVSARVEKKRKRELEKLETENQAKRLTRPDGSRKLMNVMVSERRIKTAAKYRIGDIPYPFKTKEEYERSLQMPLGDEYNTSYMVSKLTLPEVKVRSGRIIQPIKLPSGTKKPTTSTASIMSNISQSSSLKEAAKLSKHISSKNTPTAPKFQKKL